MKEIFIKFLKKHKAYKKFMFNFNEQKNWHDCSSIDEFIDRYRYTIAVILTNNSMYNYYCSYIWQSFRWRNAKEKYDYWYILNDKWMFFVARKLRISCKLEKL